MLKVYVPGAAYTTPDYDIVSLSELIQKTLRSPLEPIRLEASDNDLVWLCGILENIIRLQTSSLFQKEGVPCLKMISPEPETSGGSKDDSSIHPSNQERTFAMIC